MSTEPVKGVDETKKAIKDVVKAYEKKLLNMLDKYSILLASHTRENYLRGGTDARRLRMRSGKLARSCLPIRAKKQGDKIKAGIKFGTIYAGIHIGDDRVATVIRPKTKKFLAIPLEAAKTAAGVARGKPTDESVFGKTFIKKSKAGNLIIFGQNVFQSGSRQGETKGKIVPLFVLKKSVTIKKRISPKRLIKWVKPKIIKEMGVMPK